MMHDVLTQDYMHSLSTEWRSSVTEHASGDNGTVRDSELTLASSIQFVKYKMYDKRDTCIIADDSQRLNLCVALYEYTHRVVSLSDSDVDFVERYDNGQRYHASLLLRSLETTQEDAPPCEGDGTLVYM